MKEVKIGVLVGRFQTPYLHDGHTFIIQKAFEEYDYVMIAIGNTVVKDSIRNPLDYDTRLLMLNNYIKHNCYSHKFIGCFKQNDNRLNEVWSRNLDRNLSSFFQQWYISQEKDSFIRKSELKLSVELVGGKDSFAWAYSGVYPVKEFISEELINENATDIRTNIYTKDSVSFREGVIYSVNKQHSKVYPTVDIAIINYENNKFVLGRKPGNPLWQFPGGFVDPKDDSFEDAAKREAIEECGNIEIEDFQYLTSMKIDDWRYRKERSKVITNFFSCTYKSGELEPNDDLEFVEWHDIENFDIELLVDEHKKLFKYLQAFMKIRKISQEHFQSLMNKFKEVKKDL